MTREEALEIAKCEAMTRGGVDYDDARASVILGVYAKGVTEARIRACDQAAEMCDQEAGICSRQKSAAKGFAKSVHAGGECIAKTLAGRIRKIAENVR